jgi:hypothetical protein
MYLKKFLMLFHLAGGGSIHAFMPSPDRDPETDAPAQGDKTAGDYAYPDKMMYKSRIISYKIRNYLVH